MAFEKRFKNDFVMVKNFEDFINALYVGDVPCNLIKSDTTKVHLLKYFAGPDYESFKDFDRDIKNSKKRADKKVKVFDFLKANNLEMYPHSSYSIFLNEKKPQYEKKNPSMSLKDIKTLMTSDWSKMTPKEKQKFEDTYQQKKQEFIDKVKEIDPSFVVHFDKSQAPKGKPQAYPMYVKEQMKIFKEENNDLKSKDIMKLIGQKWKSLDSDEKKKYYDMCNDGTTESTETKPKTTTTPKKVVKADSDISDTETKKKTTVTSKKNEKVVKADSDISDTETKKKTTTPKKVVKVDSDISDTETKKKTTTTKKKFVDTTDDEILDDNDE